MWIILCILALAGWRRHQGGIVDTPTGEWWGFSNIASATAR